MSQQLISQTNILLESGTNEVEFIEFYVRDQSFGINVAKVREIVQYNEKAETYIPNTPPAIRGTFLLRGQAITIVDLNQFLFQEKHQVQERSVALITDFNNMITGFLVNGVNRIHRRRWDELKPFNGHLAVLNATVTGSIQIDDRDVLILDLESLIGSLMPSSQVGYLEHVAKDAQNSQTSRANCHLIFAEDSPFIRTNIEKHLKHNGYTDIGVCDNGAEAYDIVARQSQRAREQGEDLRHSIAALITDIEMPKLDGLTLCRRIREDLEQYNLPILVLSSLINEQMQRKCHLVGANAYLNKANADGLIQKLDEFCLAKSAKA